MIELLSPVGDFECLKAAVQSGADAVYLGGNLFNARNSAHNFNNEELKKAIYYAKLRNVKVNFTLNTLVKNDEFEDALKLAEYVYSLGVDAIIVQDLGLASVLLKEMPFLHLHASTQMTTHNLDGVLKLQNLGFKRVVLSRELSLREIEYICNNSEVEIETFIHGALCISYSGQCLLSSSIGARSGNRGKCAQPCRLPYELISESPSKKQVLDKGYLLSPRDLCGLNFIPDLIRTGVKCLKIEGRMKSPLYVSTVTRIYRKYIDLAYSDKPYVIDEKDIDELMQVFNRGGFSSGNYQSDPNEEYVYKDKPNNMGLYSGNVSNYNSKKGLITFETTENYKIGDRISTEFEEHTYTISELMSDGNNITEAHPGDVITVGRMKGKINLGDKVYKISSVTQNKQITELINKENIKIPLVATVTVKKGQPLELEITSCDKDDGNYFSMSSKRISDISPIDAISNPISIERIREQISKTQDTPFEFKYINVNIDENTYIPKISAINQLRRDCLDDLINQAIRRFHNYIDPNTINSHHKPLRKRSNKQEKPSISLLLNTLVPNDDYSKLKNVDCTYIPFTYFLNDDYKKSIVQISKVSKLFILMPVIIKDNFRNLIVNNFENILKEFDIKGIVLSSLSSVECLKKYMKNLEIVANFNFNVFNKYTIDELKKIGITKVTLSPELNKSALKELSEKSSLPVEILVYGKLPLMNTGYCLLGSSNKCYPTCNTLCRNSNKRYFLKDRLHMYFRVIPDNLQTINTIYNSKITSINYSDFNTESIRISIIDRTVSEINSIVKNVKKDIAYTGEEYTKGNLDKHV